MANGMEAKVRPGLKREFAFAFRSQSEISAGSLGRTRARTPTSTTPLSGGGVGGGEGEDGVSPGNATVVEFKRYKRMRRGAAAAAGKEASAPDLKAKEAVEVAGEEEAKSDVVELGSGDEEIVSVHHVSAAAAVGQGKSGDVATSMEEKAASGTCKERTTAEKLHIVMGLSAQGTSISLPVLMEHDGLCKEMDGGSGRNLNSKHNQVCEEGTSGLAGVVVNGKGDDEQSSPVSVKKDDCKSSMVEEKPLRRFTRSALKPRTEEFLDSGLNNDTTKVKCSSQTKLGDGGKVCKDGTSVPSTVLVEFDDSSNGKAEEKPFRRFTRSALKPKSETTVANAQPKDGSSVDNLAEDEVDDAMPTSSASANGLMRSSSKQFPSRLRDLLDSGILEGQHVNYIRSAKVRESGETGLSGMIVGSSILCFCDRCGGKETVTPATFELHAGSTNKRPPEYIFLKSGNSLRDIMNACKGASVEALEGTLQLAIGCQSLKKAKFCMNCRGSMVDTASGSSMVCCSSCMNLKDTSPPLPTARVIDDSRRSPEPLLVRRTFDSVPKASISQSKSLGRLTKKDLRLHKLVFEEDVLPDGTEVAYYSRGQKLLVGYKKGFGIFCSCCDTEVSPSQFEAHAGWASRRKPYLHIYTSNGVSLHELSVSLAKCGKFSTHENDDLCQICKDGGDLVCCDGCPRSFHKECLLLPSVPNDKWYCKFCVNNQNEKFGERNANAIAAGRVAGVDPIEEINKRCIRIVKTLDTDYGGCFFCREHDFDKSFGPRTVILCDQCEKEFHVGCLRDNNMQDLKGLPEGDWFCCIECDKIHSALQALVARGEEKLTGSCLDVVKQKHQVDGVNNEERVDLKWRLLNERVDSSADSGSLLSDAVTIFHERFDPIVVETSSRQGNRDLIPSMVYGRNIKGQELGGMYCAVLLVDNVVVSAAIIRVFGQELAELPLVATSSQFQGRGYFQALYDCLEKLLGSLHVKNFILPAAEEAESIWMNKFGFTKMTQDEVVKFRKDYQMMVFQGTSMLQKPVPNCRIVGKSEGG
ncbi:unnamed protein product [Linum tenue]|uniref:PHD-type domain-containing protein n=2 Tax=Linum tenue TaxID=586396 RepID=A0AAV0IKL9_9ROSI|nr:unnamed protein product [Linum tenue]